MSVVDRTKPLSRSKTLFGRKLCDRNEIPGRTESDSYASPGATAVGVVGMCHVSRLLYEACRMLCPRCTWTLPKPSAVVVLN